MSALKDVTIERIKQLPDDVVVEDIMYEINFIGQVIDGLKDADEGRNITTDSLLEKVNSWGLESGL